MLSLDFNDKIDKSLKNIPFTKEDWEKEKERLQSSNRIIISQEDANKLLELVLER